jgi:hypothetical protein
VKLIALLATVLVLAGCGRGGVENKEAVRQAVMDYLSKRTNLNMSSMNVDVTSVTFKGNEADATVAFSPKGGGAGSGMSLRYALERQGNRWVVKGRAGSGGHGAGGSMPMPGMQGGGQQMPGMQGGAQAPPSGEMPAGHPPVQGTPKK